MKMSIFGLGYVGSVTAACLAEMGHTVYGVDVIPQKISDLNEGIAPVKEPQLENLLKKNLEQGRLKFSMNTKEACEQSDYAMIAVGTPSDENGAVNLHALERCIASIAHCLLTINKKEFTIIIRSTVPPTTTQLMREKVQKIVGISCKVNLCINPEFLREGSAVDDFFRPALVVFGSDDLTLQKELEKIYNEVDAQFVWVDTKSAELVKYTNNAFHAIKVAFANEISRVAEAYDSDANKIMEILCMDKKLNISSKYLKPGFAFGGSCIPKDLRGIKSIAQKKSVDIPMLASVLKSNEAHIEKFKKQILETNPGRVGMLGITFKTGTDDVRESASLKLIKQLMDQGVKIQMMDSNLDSKRMMGTNRKYIDELIPAWEDYYAASPKEFFEQCDTIVMINNESIYKKWIKEFGANKQLINLTENTTFSAPTQHTDQTGTKPVPR